MNFADICAFTVVFSSILLIFSKTEKELANVISSVLFISVMLLIIIRFEAIIEPLIPIFEAVKILDSQTLLKILGICFLTLISVTVCEAVGQKGMVVAIEVFSTVEIISAFFPYIKEIFFKVLEFAGE